MAKKIIITAALTGGLHTKQTTPYLPEQPEEIAAAAYECFRAGAAIVHLHARDANGLATSEPGIYGRIHTLIRERCEIILADTTGGGPNLTLDERVQCLNASPAPEIASLNMGTMMRIAGPYEGKPFLNPRSEIERFASEMLSRGIKPEMEVYNHSMYREVQNLIDKKLVEPPYLINLVLGMGHQGGVEATPKYLFSLIDFLPKDTIVNVTAVGAAQLPLTTISMVLGTMVRVGLEDNIYYRKGQLAKSNAELVSRAVRIAREMELEIASPDEARKILGLRAL